MPLKRWILGALLVVGASRLSAQEPTADSVRQLLQTRVDDRKLVGAILTLDQPGKDRVLVSVGEERPGRKLDEQSVFEIGSITKVFTGILLADMVLRGEVRLDQPIAELLPATVKVPSRNGKVITLGNLSMQNSGLPRLPSNMAPKDPTNPYADYTVANLYEFLSGHELRRDPGVQYEYSNLGVGLLGHALALKAGKSYEALVKERILDPLGMKNTAITLSKDMRAHLAEGHDGEGKVVPNWDLPTIAGAGALRSTLADMRRFIAAAASPPNNAIGKAIAMAIEPRYTVNQSLTMGLNWHRIAMAGDTIVWHNGGTGGYRTFIGFNTRTKASVVTLANSSSDLDDISRHLLIPAFPLATYVKHVEIKLPVDTLRGYVGKYRLAPGFEISITEENGALYGQATNQPRFQLFPEAMDRVFFRVVEAQLEFGRDSSGKVVDVTLVQNGARQRASRVQ